MDVFQCYIRVLNVAPSLKVSLVRWNLLCVDHFMKTFNTRSKDIVRYCMFKPRVVLK